MQVDIAREMQIRRQVESIYNKTRADFVGLREWGDYEEEREDIIYNLTQGIDVDAVQHKLANYQKAHSDDILRNQALKAEKQRAQNRVPRESATTSAHGAHEFTADPGDAADRGYQPAEMTADMQRTVPQVIRAKTEADLAGHERPRLSMQEIGLISGWTPDLQYQRGREEAYNSLFIS